MSVAGLEPVLEIHVGFLPRSMVVALSGELDGSTGRVVRRTVVDLIARGHVDVELDLSGVTSMDGAGAASVLGILQCSEARGGTATLAAASPPVERVLRLKAS